MPDEETQRAGDAPEETEGRRPLPPTERLRLQPPFELSPDGRYHVSELLSFHDRPFVEAAFSAALGREGDPEAVAEILADLRLGRRTKLDIIESLIDSVEGRAARAGERIDGVRRGGLPGRLRALPFVGRAWSVLALVARLPQLARHQQEFEAYTMAQHQLLAEHVSDFVNRRLNEVGEHVNSQHRDMVGHVNNQRQLAADYVNEQRQRIHDYINDELRPVLADTADAVSMLSDALAAMRARVEEQQLRLDGQEEFLVQEKHEIVEAQKTALAEIEGRLGALVAAQRESLEGQRRALAEVSARVESLRASVESVRAAAGEQV
jgi:hypothetical protein